MTRLLRNLVLATLLLPFAATDVLAQQNADLATQAQAILRKHCHRCHGVNFEVPGFDVLNRQALLTPADGQPAYLVPGKPEESRIWQRAGVAGDMPPTGSEPLSPADLSTLRTWIEAGAPFPSTIQRTFKSELSLLADIEKHLASRSPADRKFQRYFTLTHLYNNATSVSEEDLRQVRAALSKMVNSLSWKDRIVVPQPIDAELTVFAVDLRSLGWVKGNPWGELLEVYPYGLKYDEHPEPAMRDASRRLFQLANDELVWVRADWFIATASRPPLYHKFLGLPKNIAALQKQLNVDVKFDFLHDRLARAGFAGSGVSGQNRLVDRHHSIYGYWWQSYDFKSNLGKGSLVHFPLGPVFKGNKFGEQAFEHAGGEVIFSLPNGLQGYYLVDKDGDRIDVGPTDIVADTLKTAGTTAIVNGLSCMACHKHGVIRFKDTVRDGIALSGDVRDKVQRLFPRHEVMDELLTKDENRYLQALDRAAGVFLRGPEAPDRNIREFAEPIGAVAQVYNRDLGPVEAALELGIENPERLSVMVQGNRRLSQLGLGQFKDGATIKREQWSSMQDDETLFHRAARELELGTPLRK
jgi:serine/threonine-protein kinase